MRLSLSKPPFAVRKGEVDEIAGLLLQQAGAALYHDNPFRLLGVSVLDGNREITKRCDKLRLAGELGFLEESPCFTPSAVPSEDRVRESARLLGDPRQRFLREFFWFWPLDYPEGRGDEALAALKAGKREEAIATWCRAVVDDHPVALHNLAVYYHYLSLDWEPADVAKTLNSDSLWNLAVRYWGRVLACEAIWTRLEQRIANGTDASTLQNAVKELRTTLPDLLAKTGADVAMSAALQGNPSRAMKLADLAMAFHGNHEEARRVLLLSAEPLIKKFKARVEEFRRLVQETPVKTLDAVVILLKESREELQVLQGFCGGATERFQEFTHGLCVALLDALVAYQRASKDDKACLPWLLHLQDRACTPELVMRASKAFEVMYDNALAGVVATKTNHKHAKSYELLLKHLLPADHLLEFDPESQVLYRRRLGTMLRALADASSPASLPTDQAKNALRVAAGLSDAKAISG